MFDRILNTLLFFPKDLFTVTIVSADFHNYASQSLIGMRFVIIKEN